MIDDTGHGPDYKETWIYKAGMHDALVEQIQEKLELTKELNALKNAIKTGDTTHVVDGNDLTDWGWTTIKKLNERKECKHVWCEVHPSWGDPRNPSGRRCEKCNKQVWY